MPLKLPFATKVVGIRYEWQRIKTYNDCKVGGKAWLMQDARNPHDPNAIEVYLECGGKPQSVGYLPAELAARIMKQFPDWLTADSVIVARGENYSKKRKTWYSLSIVITQFNERG